MIAAIYARKSTDQNIGDEEKSVTRQVERARAYAARQGWTIDDGHVYTDDAVSGAEFQKRPGYLRLMRALLPRPPFQVLILAEPSRLGRDSFRTAQALLEITEANVRVFAYLEDREITLDDEMDEIQVFIQSWSSAQERRKASQRTRDALRRKAERGHVAGGKVYGYQNVSVGDHREREVRPEEAEVIRRIFREIAAGRGFCKVAKQLNAERVPSPTGNGWAVSGVRALVFRPLYRGELVYGQTRWERRRGTKRKVRTPAAEWITVQAPALRVVDEPLWQAAHQRLADTRGQYLRHGITGTLLGRPEGSSESQYLLSGLLRCAQCGGGVYVTKHSTRRGPTRWYYVCATYRTRGRALCPHGIRAEMEPLNTAVLDHLAATVLNEGVLEAAAARAAAYHAERQAEGVGRRATLEAERDDLARKIARWWDAYEDGEAREVVKARVAGLEARQRAVVGELATLTGAPLTLDRERLRERLSDWQARLRQAPGLARQILRKLLPEPLTLAPVAEGIRFTGSAAWGVALTGLTFVTSVVPPGGPVRCDRLPVDGLYRAA